MGDDDTNKSSTSKPVKRPRETKSPLPTKRPRLTASGEKPKRTHPKRSRRCFQCRKKLQLVEQETGSCRCDKTFCTLHRLPEQHNCSFNHKDHLLKEAMKKMVKCVKKHCND